MRSKTLPYFLYLQLMNRRILIILFLALSEGIYAQEKDTIVKPRILREWNLSGDFSAEVDKPVDTLFSLFNRYRLADRFSSFNASLGNYGLPFYQINFFDRITDPDKFLYSTYYPFMYVPEKVLFMNTQTPFTELDWSFAGPKERSEQTFRVRHSQNVNRFLNFGVIYDIVYSLGQYNYQRSENKTFTFYSSYTGDKYKLYFAAGVNNIVSHENGGVIDKNVLGEFEPNKIRDIPVNLGSLNDASSTLKNRNLLLVQRYTIGGRSAPVNDSTSLGSEVSSGLKGTVSHIFILENNRRSYYDDYPKSGFYDSIYINSSATFDSLYSRTIKNCFRFDFATDESRQFRLGGGVGFRNEILRFSQIVPTHDAMLADTMEWNKNTNALVGKLFNSIGDKFSWVATGELYLNGYRGGDFNLNGEITKSFDWKKGRASWLITGSMSNRQPSFWYNQWGGNHFEWNNNFDKEFRINVGTSFLYPARKAEIKVTYAIIDNYTDFGLDALPAQFSGGLSVAAMTIVKDLQLWKFHLDNEVLIQKSSNSDVLDLPFATIRSAGYFEHLFRFEQTGGKLNFQAGADVTLHTLYHPYSYMPATGRFYRQDQSTAGNYPFINVFVNLKVKRTRIFVMFDHINAGYMGYNYDMVPYYPMNIRMFRYGIAWTFYN